MTTGASDGPIEDPGTDDDFVNPTTYAILCISALASHHALVRLEAWTAQPDAEGAGGWEVTRTIRLRKAHVPARAFSPFAPGECEIPLPIEPDQPVFARIACKGRQRVREFPGVPPDGTEQWLLQFWPA